MSEALGLAYWAAAVVGKATVDEAAYARMRTHPRFAEACEYSARVTLGRLEGDTLMSRAVKDLSRIFYGVFALYLDARDELTLTGIQEFCAETGLASPGRAAAILIQLRMLGYITRDPDPVDKRRRRFVPAPLMKQSFIGVFRDELLALSLIEPEAAIAGERLSDPDLLRHFILIMGAGFANIARSRATTPITPFADRNAGLAMLYKLAMPDEEGDAYPARRQVRMSVRDIARRFAVSRSHVLRFLRDAEEAKLLRRSADESTGFLEEALRESLFFLHATTFMGTAACIYQAMRVVDGEDVTA